MYDGTVWLETVWAVLRVAGLSVYSWRDLRDQYISEGDTLIKLIGYSKWLHPSPFLINELEAMSKHLRVHYVSVKLIDHFMMDQGREFTDVLESTLLYEFLRFIAPRQVIRDRITIDCQHNTIIEHIDLLELNKGSKDGKMLNVLY